MEAIQTNSTGYLTTSSRTEDPTTILALRRILAIPSPTRDIAAHPSNEIPETMETGKGTARRNRRARSSA